MRSLFFILLFSLAVGGCFFKKSKPDLDKDFERAITELQCVLLAYELQIKDWTVVEEEQNLLCRLSTNLKTTDDQFYSVQFFKTELNAITQYRSVVQTLKELRGEE